jgi:hypothetical protein
MPAGLKIVAYVLAILAVTIAADRVLAQRLYKDPERLVPAYRTFNEPSVGVKLHELDKTKVYLDTLVLGNSRTYAAVNPDVFDHRLSERDRRVQSFNLAQPTIDTRFWPPFFERFYDRRAPRNVLLGIMPRDIDVRNPVAVAQEAAFLASPGFENRNRTRVWKDAEEGLADLYSLHGRGNEIRHAGPKALLRGVKLDRPGFRPRGDRGWAVFDPSLVLPKAELAANARRLANRSGSIRLRVGASQLAAIARLDRDVRAKGGCLTLFTLPVLYDREELGTIEVQREFERVLRDFVRAHPTVGLLDIAPRVQAGYGLGDFADGDHMNPTGSTKFSDQLADAVAPRLRSRDGGCGSAP